MGEFHDAILEAGAIRGIGVKLSPIHNVDLDVDVDLDLAVLVLDAFSRAS